MKQLSLLFLIIILSSCKSTKKVITSTPKEEIKQQTTETAKSQQPQPKTESTTTKTQPLTSIVASTEAFNHNDWNTLLKKHVSAKGNVDYKSFKSNRKQLTNYITALSKNLPKSTWTKQDKLAYWINAYNALTVDLILRNYPVKSIKDIKDPWEQRLWKLGQKWYNLEEIEHQIIRKMNEPRIHFALVCAAKSCPKLNNKAFTASNLDFELTTLTKAFLSDTSKNTITQNNIEISKIFKWFTKDFKENGSLIDFLNKYTETTISENAKKSYKDYNWELNN